MSKSCPACRGTGTVASDCPYCRSTDEFEFEHLQPVNCKACQGRGYLEEACPVCGGTGSQELKAPSLAKASSF